MLVNEVLIEGNSVVDCAIFLKVILVHLLELLGRRGDGDAHREPDVIVALAPRVVRAVRVVLAVVEVPLLAVCLLADVPIASLRDVPDANVPGLALKGAVNPEFTIKTIGNITALLVLSDLHPTLALVVLTVTEIVKVGA